MGRGGLGSYLALILHFLCPLGTLRAAANGSFRPAFFPFPSLSLPLLFRGPLGRMLSITACHSDYPIQRGLPVHYRRPTSTPSSSRSKRSAVKG